MTVHNAEYVRHHNHPVPCVGTSLYDHLVAQHGEKPGDVYETAYTDALDAHEYHHEVEDGPTMPESQNTLTYNERNESVEDGGHATGDCKGHPLCPRCRRERRATNGSSRAMPEYAEYGTSVNDITMDEIRAKYEVLDRIIKNPMYDGKALQSEAWEAFQEIRSLRISLEEAQLRSIEARNPGIDIKEVRRHRNGRDEQ